jgi:2-polyprenyl-3-methyl-5-hydroxy-6-metoxy-1,4-benzoquinol methylase
MIKVTECPICKSTDLRHHLITRDYTLTNEEFTIEQCVQCGIGITNPRPEDKELGKYYQSSEYISHTGKANSIIDRIYLIARTFTLRQKLNLIRQVSSGSNLLDYGCGTGDFAQYCKQQGFSVQGVEPSAPARAKAQERGLTIKEEIAQIEHQGFDIITLWHVLEHVPDINQTLQALKSRLKADGTLVIAVPNLNSWDSTSYGKYWAGYDTPRHLWHFSQYSIKKLAAAHKLKVAETKPMVLDSFYVSLLSEKYKNDKKIGITAMTKAFFNGLKSNLNARNTSDYSSLIYILKNEK